MIDGDLIKSLPVDTRRETNLALATLYRSGILDKQIEREKQRITEGNADLPLETAAEELVRYRRAIQSLQTFAQLCRAANTEINNA